MISEMIEIHTCEFCRKHYKNKSFALAHEDRCYKNPKNIHKCTHGDCKHLVKEAVEYGDEGNMRTHFSCPYHANTELYSSIAENKPYLMESIQNGDDDYKMRMPVKCDWHETSTDIFQNLDAHNKLHKEITKHQRKEDDVKTAEQRAEEFLMRMAIGNWPWEEMIVHVAVLLKEQDKITREAADDAISCLRQDHDGMIDIIDAQRAVLNVKAV